MLMIRTVRRILRASVLSMFSLVAILAIVISPSESKEKALKGLAADLIKKWEKEAENGNTDAVRTIAYLKFEQGKKEFAIRKFEYLARHGDNAARIFLGNYYKTEEKINRNFMEASKWYVLAADSGSSVAMRELGKMSLAGIGRERNVQAAKDLFEDAWKLGDVSAGYNLALMNIFLNSDRKPDYSSENVSLLNDLSHLNFPPAQYTLARYYLDYEPNKIESYGIPLLLNSATAGHPPAQYNMGKLYKKGVYVEKDMTKAVHWFAVAARGGHALAQEDLALRYERGEGVVANNALAVGWAKLAAEAGVRTAYDQFLTYKAELSPDEFSEGLERSALLSTVYEINEKSWYKSELDSRAIVADSDQSVYRLIEELNLDDTKTVGTVPEN